METDVIIVEGLSEVDFVSFAVENLDVKAERLKLLDKNLERFGYARLGNVETLDDSLVGVYTADNVVRLDSEDFLKCICCTLCFECPDFHFTETLAAELSFTAEGLLGDE